METDHSTGLNGAVAAVLRGEAAAQGVTQQQIATASGISLTTVQRLFATKRAIDVEALDKIARCLHMDAQEVMLAAVARLTVRGEGD